jgi:hypothetical protein
MHARALTFSVFLCWACGNSQAASPSRPPRERGIGPVQAVPNAPAPAAIEQPSEPPPPLPAAKPEGTNQAQAQPEDQPAEEEKPQRNFSNELVQLVGSPLDCLKVRPPENAPSTLEISLSTKVMPSGAVAGSEVSAPGLEADELACLRRRVEKIHFAQPIENAPFPVSGSLRLTRGAPGKL